MDILALDALAARLMRGRKSHQEREIGAVYDHGKRVATGVAILRKAITEDGSHDGLLRAAAMFHDVGKGIEPHEISGAAIVREMLKGYVTDGELAEISRLIACHCDRRPEDNTYDLWARLLQDADLIDHYGTYDIWMCFNYYAYTGQEGIAKAAEYMNAEFRQRAAEHRAYLNYEISKKIYDDKVAFEEDFTERLLVESQGRYVITE